MTADKWTLAACRERDAKAQENNTDEIHAEDTCPLMDAEHTRRECQYGVDDEDRHELLALVGRMRELLQELCEIRVLHWTGSAAPRRTHDLAERAAALLTQIDAGSAGGERE